MFLTAVVDPEPGAAKVEIALVGDPRQLSPSVYSTDAANAGLARSWMERLLQLPVPRHDDELTNSANNFESGYEDGEEHNDMLGPAMVQMNDWLRYSLQREGQELSHFLTLNYRVSKKRHETVYFARSSTQSSSTILAGTRVLPDGSKRFVLRRPLAAGWILRGGFCTEDRG